MPRAAATEPMHDVETPRQTTCEQVAELLGIPLQRTVKLHRGDGEAGKLHILLLRGDHSLNEVKASKLPGLADFRFATEDEIRAHFDCRAGYHRPGRYRPHQ